MRDFRTFELIRPKDGAPAASQLACLTQGSDPLIVDIIMERGIQNPLAPIEDLATLAS